MHIYRITIENRTESIKTLRKNTKTKYRVQIYALFGKQNVSMFSNPIRSLPL